MSELKDKIELWTVLIGFITNIIGLIFCIYKNLNMFFLVIMIFSCTAMIGFGVLLIIRNPALRRYKFVRFLFFEVKENKFNIVPKAIMFYDLKKKRNDFRVKEINVSYILKENGTEIDADINWTLKNIFNVKSKDFYFYTGIDRGDIKKQKLTISINNTKKTIGLLQDNRIDSKNDVLLCHWDIPSNTIKEGKKIDEIELTVEEKNVFDFNHKEAIYFFPWNFGEKIEIVNFKISYPNSLGKISMQLFEAGKIKGKKFPFNRSLETTATENFCQQDNTNIYEFSLNQEKLNMHNLYYILLHKT